MTICTETHEQANPFALNIGHLLTRRNPEQAVSEAMEALVAQRISWENHELTAANEALYALLQHCYSLHNAMSGTGVAAKALKRGLANYISTLGYVFTEATPLITKIVKCVFGMDRRRVSAYASALKVAIAEGKQVMELPKFFKDHGGIEQVRRSNTKKPKTVKERAALGRSVLEGDVLATISSDTLNANFSNQKTEEGVVLLATHETDGSFAVRRVVQNQSVINSALATFATVGAEQQKAQELIATQQAVEEQRAAARAALKVA
jgi:endonuclease III